MAHALSPQTSHEPLTAPHFFIDGLISLRDTIISWACNFFDMISDAIAYVLPQPEYEVINLFPTEAELNIPPQKEEPARIWGRVKALTYDPTSSIWGTFGLCALTTVAVSAHQVSCLVRQGSALAGFGAVSSACVSLTAIHTMWAIARTRLAAHNDPGSCRIPGSAEALHFNASPKQALLAAERVKYILSHLSSKDGKHTFYERYLDCLNQSPQELVDIRNPQAAADKTIRTGLCYGWTHLQLLRLSHNDAMTSKELSSFSEEEQTRVLTLQMLSNITRQMATTDSPAYNRILRPLDFGIPYALKYPSRARGPLSDLHSFSSRPSIAEHLSHNIHCIRKTALTPKLPYSASIQEYRQKFQEALSYFNDPHKIISGTIRLSSHRSAHAMWFRYSDGKMRIQDSLNSEGGIFECQTQEQFFDVLHRRCLACGKDMGKETQVQFYVHEIERNGFEQSPPKC